MITSEDQIANVLENRYDMKPKFLAISYAKPYLEEFNRLPPPPKYKVPEFSKFGGADNTRTIEHITRYTTQLGVTAADGHMKVWLFSSSFQEPHLGGTHRLRQGLLLCGSR